MLRKSTTHGVTGPTAVLLRGKIASPNHVVSPVTGIRCAILRSYFFSVSSPGTPVLHSELQGTNLVVAVRSQRVFVPLHELDVYFKGANPVDTMLGQLPPGLSEDARAVLEAPLAEQTLGYRELRLLANQPVRLHATIAPMTGGGQYRTAGVCDYIVEAGTERARLSADVVERAF